MSHIESRNEPGIQLAVHEFLVFHHTAKERKCRLDAADFIFQQCASHAPDRFGAIAAVNGKF